MPSPDPASSAGEKHWHGWRCEPCCSCSAPPASSSSPGPSRRSSRRARFQAGSSSRSAPGSACSSIRGCCSRVEPLDGDDRSSSTVLGKPPRRLELMEGVRITPRGYCHGVVEEIRIAKREGAARAGHEPVTMLGYLVHNEHVTRELEAPGVALAAVPV